MSTKKTPMKANFTPAKEMPSTKADVAGEATVEAKAEEKMVSSPAEMTGMVDTLVSDPTPTVADPPAPEVSEPSAQQTPKKQPSKKEITFAERVEELKEVGTNREKNLIYVFGAYIEAMKPGLPQKDQRVIIEEIRLWQAIKQLFSNSQDFEQGMHLVIGYMREHNDSVFNDRYIYRGFDTDQNLIDSDNAEAFFRITHMLKIAAGVKSYQQVKQFVDIERTMTSPVFNEEARNRVLGFFS